MEALPSSVEWRQAEGSVSFLGQNRGVQRHQLRCVKLMQFKTAAAVAQAGVQRPLPTGQSRSKKKRLPVKPENPVLVWH